MICLICVVWLTFVSQLYMKEKKIVAKPCFFFFKKKTSVDDAHELAEAIRVCLAW